MRTLPLFGQPFPSLPDEAWTVLIIFFSFARPARAGTTAPVTATSVLSAPDGASARIPSTPRTG